MLAGGVSWRGSSTQGVLCVLELFQQREDPWALELWMGIP